MSAQVPGFDTKAAKDIEKKVSSTMILVWRAHQNPLRHVLWPAGS